MDTIGSVPPVPKMGPLPGSLWASLLACAAAALCVSCGTIHREQHADSLLAVLNSVQQWTPFMWDQDRYGMIVPLLALPIRSPLANMIAQGFLTTFCGLAVFFLIPRYFQRDASAPIAGALGAAGFLALTPSYYRFEYLIDASYGTSFTLSLGSLLLLERAGSPLRLALALAMIGAANWVNSSASMVLTIAVLLNAILSIGRIPAWSTWKMPGSVDEVFAGIADLARQAWSLEPVRAITVLWFGHEVGRLLATMAPDGAQLTSYQIEPMSDWSAAWASLAHTSWAALDPQWWPCAIAIEAAVGLTWCLSRRRQGDACPAWKGAAALTGTATALGLLVGTTYWVRINNYEFRYLFTSAILAQGAAAILVAPALLALRPGWVLHPRAIAGLVLTVMLGVAVEQYGWPSPSAVRRDLDQRFGALTEDILAAECTHVAGDYWTVWPAVFHAMIVHHDRNDGRSTWGLTFRSSPTVNQWASLPRGSIRIAIPRGDTMAETYLRGSRLTPWVETEGRRSIRVVHVVARPPRSMHP